MLDRTFSAVVLGEKQVCLVDFADWLKATTRIQNAYFITFFWWVITKKPPFSSSQVPLPLRTAPALHLPGHPQHPALLRHEESRAEEAEADDQQDEAGEEAEGGEEEHDGQVEERVSV